MLFDNFNILQYQCFKLAAQTASQDPKEILLSLVPFFVGLASLISLFFWDKVSWPKGTLKVILGICYYNMLAVLYQVWQRRKEASVQSGFWERSNPPRGLPFVTKFLKCLYNCKILFSACIRTKKVLIYQSFDIVTSVIKSLFE